MRRNRRRRWFQYSLRSMLLLMLLVSIPMGRLAVKLQGDGDKGKLQ